MLRSSGFNTADNEAHAMKLILALHAGKKVMNGRVYELVKTTLGEDRCKRLCDAVAGFSAFSEVSVANAVVDSLFSAQKRPRG